MYVLFISPINYYCNYYGFIMIIIITTTTTTNATIH